MITFQSNVKINHILICGKPTLDVVSQLLLNFELSEVIVPATMHISLPYIKSTIHE